MLLTGMRFKKSKKAGNISRSAKGGDAGGGGCVEGGPFILKYVHFISNCVQMRPTNKMFAEIQHCKPSK